MVLRSLLLSVVLRSIDAVRIGVVFPQTEIGAEVGAVRAYAEGVEELGFSHVLVYDHVVGADPAVHAPWTGPYDVHTAFHEPMVLFLSLIHISEPTRPY